MSFMRYCRTISKPLKKTMMPGTLKSTVNTGLYEYRNYSMGTHRALRSLFLCMCVESRSNNSHDEQGI